jgi:hypothetical protein
MHLRSGPKLMLALLAVAAAAMAIPAVSSAAKLEATLTGGEVVPGPGDADGEGAIHVNVKPKAGEYCYVVGWTGLDGAKKAHIHRGKAGSTGPRETRLFRATPELPGLYKFGDCDEVNRGLLRKMKRHPRRYYVDIHNSSFPGGALRGQLVRPAPN